VIGAVVVWFGLRAGPLLAEQWRAGRALAELEAAAHDEPNGEGGVVEADLPFAVAAGLFAPRVLISDGLREALSDRQLDVVRAHESLHVRRHHTLLQASVDLAGLLHLPAVRVYLGEEVGLACEQIADREAARAVGGEVAVAETILDVEKLVRVADSPAALSRATGMGGGDLERRVVGLLQEPWRAVGRARLVVTTVTAVTAVGLIVGSDDAIHHGLETLLSLLL
jgi:beta-lactamase regulating signal transducer with metallopeptidase domain